MKRTYMRPQVAVIVPTDNLLDGFKDNKSWGGDPSIGRAKHYDGYAPTDGEEADDDPWASQSLWEDN